jgi:uncharacterized membrane protein YjdF
MYKFSNDPTIKKENFIKFTGLRNGFLKKFINKHEKKTSRLEFNEVLNILFMFLLLLRTIISVTISNEDYTVLMYIGRGWHYVGANYVHNEVLFLLWTLHSICVYVFVINSPTNRYKWIEIFAFLKGFVPHQQIGKYLFLFSLGLFSSTLKLNYFETVITVP